MFWDKSPVFLGKSQLVQSRPSGYKVTAYCLYPCQFLHFESFTINFTWVITYYILLIAFWQLYLHCRGLLDYLGSKVFKKLK